MIPLELLRCPAEGTALRREGSVLVSGGGREYPIVDDVPVLLRDDAEVTLWVARASLEAAWAHVRGEGEDAAFLETIGISEAQRAAAEAAIAAGEDPADAVIAQLIAATSGNLYLHLVGRRGDHRIPELRLRGAGETLLDVGCSWGRWVVAAARAGFRPTGVDPSLGAVLAAKRLCGRLGVEADFVVGDARWLPFPAAAFDTVHSYSVIQHLSRDNARRAFAEAGRVLRDGGRAFIQMANALGARCVYNQLRRGFREPRDFEVRYWRPAELRRLGESIGPTELEIDGFFGLGVQPSDYDALTATGRAVVRASEGLRRVAGVVPPLVGVADSIYVSARREGGGADG